MNRAFHIAGLVWCGLSAALLCVPFGSHLGMYFGFILSAISLLILAFMFLWGRKKLPLWVFSAVTAVCFSSIFSSCEHFNRQILVEVYGGTVQTLRGLVIDNQTWGDSRFLTLRMEVPGIQSAFNGKQMRIISPVRVGAQVGDVVEYTLRLPKNSSEQRMVFSRGNLFEVYQSQEPLEIERRQNDIRVSLYNYREEISAQFTKMLPRGEGAILAAMITGRGQEIEPSLREVFSKAGVAHLLAVSGLHMAILIGILDVLLGFALFSKRQRLLIEMLAVIGYMALTGFYVSVMRAGIMMLLCRGAMLLGRDSDSLNSLGISIILILLTNPYGVFNTGLQLSYLATMGIATFGEPLSQWLCGVLLRREWWIVKEERPIIAAIISCVGVTLSAQLLTAPVVCMEFGSLPLVSPLANLMVAPLAGITLGLGMACGITGLLPFGVLFSKSLGFLAGLSLRFITGVARVCAALPLGAIVLREKDLLFWMIGILVVFVSLWIWKAPGRLLVWVMELAACSLVSISLSRAILWGNPLVMAVPEYGETVALAYGSQGAVLGVPDSLSEAEQLMLFFDDYKVTSICLYIPQSKELLSAETAQPLMRAFPPEAVFPMDNESPSTMRLFNKISLSMESGTNGTGEETSILRFEAGGLSIVKEFAMEPVNADILINGRNEIIGASGVPLPKNNRYYGVQVVQFGDG